MSNAAINDKAMRISWTIVLALSAAIFVWLKGEVVLLDPDTQWHVAVGRLIIETGAMPRVDTMSHTYAGQPWIAKEWLSQVLYYLAYAAGGWPAVTMLTALAVAACVAIIAWRLTAALTPVLVLGLIWLVIISLLGISAARPHVLALPAMALFTVMLLNAAETRQTPPWLALPVLTIWANLHAAFTLGYVIAACLALDALLRAAPERRPRLVLQWGLFGLGCIGAACIHPYGAQSLLINLDMMRGNESVPLINEWDRHVIFGAAWFRIVLPALLVATLAAFGPVNAGRLLLGVFAVFLTWKHQRFVMMLAVVAPLITRDTVAAAVAALCQRFGLFQGVDPLRDPKWRAPAMVAAIAAFLAVPALLERPALPHAAAPVAALASVPPEVRALPVYNSYNFGGFLVLEKVPTFIDGRTDQLFTDNFMARFHGYMKRGEAQAFLDFIEKRGARWAIVQKDQDDLKLLENAPNWRLHYADDQARVFIRQGG